MGYIHTVLLGHPVQNICFTSIKKIFLQALVFRYHIRYHKNENVVKKFKNRICFYIFIYIYPKKLQFSANGQFVLVK